jgi:hypothetical protein
MIIPAGLVPANLETSAVMHNNRDKDKLSPNSSSTSCWGGMKLKNVGVNISRKQEMTFWRIHFDGNLSQV